MPDIKARIIVYRTHVASSADRVAAFLNANSEQLCFCQPVEVVKRSTFDREIYACYGWELQGPAFAAALERLQVIVKTFTPTIKLNNVSELRWPYRNGRTRVPLIMQKPTTAAAFVE